jgi:hypothetical protein
MQSHVLHLKCQVSAPGIIFMRCMKMKTTLQIEIESKDIYPILYEDGDVEEDYSKERRKELPKFQKQYAKDLHKAVITSIKDMFNPDEFIELFLDSGGEELYIEGWDSLEDYGIKIKLVKK